MKRVKITFPDTPPLASFAFPLRIADINYGGHLGNDRVLSLAHEARAQMLAQYGFSEMDCGGHSLIMADAEIAFRAEAFYGEILDISVFTGDASAKGFSLYYRMTKSGQDATVVAEVRTGMVAFDYEERKVASLSGIFRKKLNL